MKKIIYLLFALLFSGAEANAQKADSLLNFIVTHKDKSSLYLVKNDTVIAKLNEHKKMPLASTVKILVAIEFAKQVGAAVLNESSMVALKELDKYYIPLTDGGAHEKWLTSEKKLGDNKNDSVSLLNVARGMIQFSSNANTEYLMDILGIDNVKNNLQLMGITEHTPVQYLVASLFMYQNPKKKTEKSILKGIKNLNEQQYARYIFDMHKALAYDTVLKQKFNPADLTLAMQKLWSDRLTASNTYSYAQIGSILNNRKLFGTQMYDCLKKVLETVMENPGNQTWLSHAGMKGGSTMWVLTKMLYATTLPDNAKIEMAYFFNDLDPAENAKLQKWMNDFEYQVLTNPIFREKIRTALK